MTSDAQLSRNARRKSFVLPQGESSVKVRIRVLEPASIRPWRRQASERSGTVTFFVSKAQHVVRKGVEYNLHVTPDQVPKNPTYNNYWQNRTFTCPASKAVLVPDVAYLFGDPT